MKRQGLEAAETLLAPSALRSAEEILSGQTATPKTSGVYALWLDIALNGMAPPAIFYGQWRLAYVGIAGATTGLRRRLRQHLKGPCAVSTLRRALAALLVSELNLDVALSPRRKVLLTGEGEARLSAWLSAHGRFAWMEHASPRTLESTLITDLAPPLNVAGSPAAHAIKEARTHLRARAAQRQ